MANASRTAQRTTSPLRSDELVVGRRYTVTMRNGEQVTGMFDGLREGGTRFEHINLLNHRKEKTAIWIGIVEDIQEGNK